MIKKETIMTQEGAVESVKLTNEGPSPAYISPEATFTITPDLRPHPMAAMLSTHSKLMATRFALEQIRRAIDAPRDPVTHRKWTNADRSTYIRNMCDDALRQSK